MRRPLRMLIRNRLIPHVKLLLLKQRWPKSAAKWDGTLRTEFVSTHL